MTIAVDMGRKATKQTNVFFFFPQKQMGKHMPKQPMIWLHCMGVSAKYVLFPYAKYGYVGIQG